MSNIIIFILCWFANLVGLVQWGVLVLLLMEVIVCKDATTVNASRILNKSISARLRLFQRSFRSVFYRASIGLFFGAFMAMCYMMEKLWTTINVKDFYPWTLFSLFVPFCLYLIYREIGYSLTLFDKFKLWIRKEHE